MRCLKIPPQCSQKLCCDLFHTDYARGRKSRGCGFIAVCLSVFPGDISKTDAATITKLDIQKFYDESWKPVYFLVKKSKVKVTTFCRSSDRTQY